jgi:hypothetical protein
MCAALPPAAAASVIALITPSSFLEKDIALSCCESIIFR